MFRVRSHLRDIRTKLQNWCLSHRKLWGINWKEVNSKLNEQVNDRMDLRQGNMYIEKINELIPIHDLQYRYWLQRMKERWIKEGDCNSTTMYRTVKQRKSRNEITCLRNDHEEWVEGQEQVANLILDSLVHIFNPTLPTHHGEDIDLTLRQLSLPKISEANIDILTFYR